MEVVHEKILDIFNYMFRGAHSRPPCFLVITHSFVTAIMIEPFFARGQYDHNFTNQVDSNSK